MEFKFKKHTIEILAPSDRETVKVLALEDISIGIQEISKQFKELNRNLETQNKLLDIIAGKIK